MTETKPASKDPICEIIVDEATAIHAERAGRKFYFYSDYCRQNFWPFPLLLRRKASLDAAVDSRRLYKRGNEDEL